MVWPVLNTKCSNSRLGGARSEVRGPGQRASCKDLIAGHAHICPQCMLVEQKLVRLVRSIPSLHTHWQLPLHVRTSVAAGRVYGSGKATYGFKSADGHVIFCMVIDNFVPQDGVGLNLVSVGCIFQKHFLFLEELFTYQGCSAGDFFTTQKYTVHTSGR